MPALFLNTFVKIFFLLTPFVAVSSFLMMTAEESSAKQKQVALRTTIALVFMTLGLYFFGNYIFKAFGITLDAFRIGAGAVLFLSAVSLVRGSTMYPQTAGDQDISVVPLAMPIIIGPGTTGALLLMGAETAGVDANLANCGAIVVASLAVGALLFTAASSKRFLRPVVLSVLSKLTGLVVASLAAQLVFSGIKSFLAT